MGISVLQPSLLDDACTQPILFFPQKVLQLVGFLCPTTAVQPPQSSFTAMLNVQEVVGCCVGFVVGFSVGAPVGLRVAGLGAREGDFDGDTEGGAVVG